MRSTIASKADGATVRADRLAFVIHLATAARDAGVDYPADVSFHPDIKLVRIEFRELADAAAWAMILNGSTMTDTGRTEEYTHYHSEIDDWNGYRVDVQCLVKMPELAKPVLVAADASALLDSLVADMDVR